MELIKNFVLDFIFIFYSYFVCNIPCWSLRRFFYKIGGMQIGEKSRIMMKTVIIKPWRIKIGNNSYINEACHIGARGGVEIMDNVSVSIGTMIITGTHDSQSENFKYKEEYIKIENNVWIGARCIILPGVVLKKDCLIGAGSTVKKGIYKEDGFYSGVPARYISQRKLKGEYTLYWSPFFR